MSKIKDVLLIANFWHFEFEKKSSRYRTMADVLCEAGYYVEVVSSSFRHQTKTQRDTEYIKTLDSAYKVTLLREPDYKKNVSLQRIYSHHCFAKEVTKYLESRKNPDLIICSVPSLPVGSAVTKFAKEHKIKIIIDIQDLWPEAFKMALNIPVVSDVLFAPMMMQANKIYSRADKVMAVSETYVKRGLQNNNNDKNGLSVFIGTDSRLVEEAIDGKTFERNDNEFWVGYVGALGHSYDIPTVIDALTILKNKGYENIVFKIMGEGVLIDEFKKYAAEKQVNCEFAGFMEYGDMMATLMACDCAVNPIIGKSVSSIINKVSDYAMAGVPVINTQNSPEYRALLEEYECGINCENGNAQAMADAILKLYNDEKLKNTMGENSLKLAKERFDRAVTYKNVVALIEGMEQ